MKRIFLTVLILLLSVIPSFAEKNGISIGAIKYDAYCGALDSSCLEMETCLGPLEYHNRLPFYGTVVSSTSVQARCITQACVDQELAYAKAAGIDYFAYLIMWDYDGTSTERKLHLSSANKNDVKFAVILLHDSDTAWTEGQITSLLGWFQDSAYKKVTIASVARPLVYLYGGTGWTSVAASNIATLRTRCAGAGIADPYVVDMSDTHTIGASSTAQARSKYAWPDSAWTGYTTDGVDHLLGPYSTLANYAKAQWESYSVSVPGIPTVVTGLDGRPYADHNPGWFTPEELLVYRNYYTWGTPTEIANHLLDAVNFAAANPTKVPAQTVLIYAWNEFTEGGWISPLLTSTNTEGHGRLNAIKSVLTSSANTADPLSTAKTQALLTYLRGLPSLSSNKVLSGQFDESDGNPAATNCFTKLGKRPALLGKTFHQQKWGANVLNDYIAWGSAGGIIMETWYIDYPNGDDLWGGPGEVVDIPTMLTEGTALNTWFKGKLDAEYALLKTLSDNNIPVIFRPWIEMNGGWFWWGNKGKTQYTNLWVYTFNYLTNIKGLHNLLWCFSPNSTYTTDYYPGSDYVDIVGFDSYGTGSGWMSGGPRTDYLTLSALNKPIIMAEYGYYGASAASSPQTPVDLDNLITSIKSYLPNLVAWMNWDGNPNLVFQLCYSNDTTTILNDAWVITRDEVSYYGTSSYALSVSVTGTGSGSVVSSPAGINCSTGTCSYSFSPQSILLTVTPSSGHTISWSGGGCTGSSTTCTISLAAPTSVTVTLTAPVASTSHWVSTTGSAPWTGTGSCTGSSDPGIYCSLATANSSASAGETVYIKPGTYSTQIAPANSGTSISNRIIFSRISGQDKPVIAPSGCSYYGCVPVSLSGKSYIKVDGIIGTSTTLGALDLTYGSHYNEIANCEFSTTAGGSWIGHGTAAGTNSNHNWVHHNIFGGAGHSGTCGEGSDCIRMGGVNACDTIPGGVYSINNTIEYNLIYNCGHATLDAYDTQFTVLRGNIHRNTPWHPAGTDCNACVQGPYGFPSCGQANYTDNDWDGYWSHRNMQMGMRCDGARTYTLIEGNRYGFNGQPPSNADASLTLAGRGNLVRQNYIYGSMRMGLYFKSIGAASGSYRGGGIDNRVYNNTIYHNGWGFEGGGWNATSRYNVHTAGTCPQCTLNCDNYLKNNIVYMGQDGNYGTLCANSSYDLTTDPKFTNGDVTSDPSVIAISQNLFSDKPGYASTALPDLTLQATSPAINAGTHLTTATNSGSSSTTLTVADAFYFQDGTWGSDLVRAYGTMQADWIAIGTVSNIVKIGSINYTNNTITLAESKSWSNGASVWLYKNSAGTIVLVGAAPDIGAHEYGETPPAGDTTAPTIVTDDLSATALSYPAINLFWSAFQDNTAVTGYRIYRCTGASCTPSAQTGVSSGTSYQDTNLTASTVYGYTVRAVDAAGNLSNALTVKYATTPTADTNIALGKTVSSSSEETGSFLDHYVVDGSLTTRWASLYADPQWIKIDLGGNYEINRVILRWETAYGKDYTIQYSVDDASYTTAVTVAGGDGGEDNHAISPAVTARYVKVNGTARGTAWGYSLYEFEIYGTAATNYNEAESCTLASPMSAVADGLASGGYYVRSTVADSGTATCNFSVDSNGTYKIVTRAYATSAATDSFYVQVDALGEDVWDLNPTGDAGQYNTYREDEVTKRGTGTAQVPQYDPYTFDLTAGAHTVTFRGREAGARLDNYRLVKVSGTDQYTLTYTKAGTGSGVVLINGINCSGNCSYNFDIGTPITITGTAGGDSTFTGFSGGLCSGTDPCSFTMTQARAVTATFNLNPPTHSITISKGGSGSGAVTSNPAGIDCGSTCEYEFTEDTTITLIPVATSGSVFSGWTGDCSGGVTNLITNGEFTSNTTGWTTHEGCGYPDATLSSVSGGQSGNGLQIERICYSQQTAYQNIATTVGKRYRFTGYVKSGTSANESFLFTAWEPGVNTIGNVTGTTSNGWTPYSFEFVATSTTTDIILVKQSSTAGTMLFDSISVVELTEIAEIDADKACTATFALTGSPAGGRQTWGYDESPVGGLQKWGSIASPQGAKHYWD